MPNGFAGLHITAYYSDILQAPWCQAAGYLVGMAAGYILYTCKCKMLINKVSSTGTFWTPVKNLSSLEHFSVSVE